MCVIKFELWSWKQGIKQKCPWWVEEKLIMKCSLWNPRFPWNTRTKPTGYSCGITFVNVSNLLSWAVPSWFLTAWNLGKWFIWIYELIYEPTYHLLFIANKLSNIGEKKKIISFFEHLFWTVNPVTVFFFFDYLALITWLHFLNKNVYVNKEILLNLVFFI